MKFDSNISKDEYIKFWKSNPNQHFLNSYYWGEINKKNSGRTPLYVGLRDENNNIVCETLLLRKDTPFKMCYLYAPRGYLIDWDNKEVLKVFTEELKKYMESINAIYLRVDPAVSYQDIDLEANPIPGGNNNYELFNYIVSLGYQHKGFYKLYNGNQPRYTFRTINKNYYNFEEVEQTISKTFMRSIKRSYNYDLVIEESNSIDEFYELVQKVSRKDGFKAYTKKYYEDIFNEFKKDNYIKNFIAKINIDKVIAKFEEQIKSEKNEDRINKLNKDINFLKENRKGDKDLVIASLICIYTENGAWSLYIGNDNIAEYTGTVNRLYYEFMKDAYLSNKEFSDLFGTVGDPHTKYKNLAGIYEYKRKLGGTYIEWLGDFDLVNKKFWYKVLPILLKIYRTIKR